MTDREVMQQALEALESAEVELNCEYGATEALRERLAREKKLMPITDDHGQALKPQYRVIKTAGNWRLLYDQMQVGEATRHEFRITKMTHDIALYPGITLEEAIKRFDERVEADHE